MWLDTDYEKKVLNLCDSLEVGKVFDIEVYVDPERREKFNEIVKYYIDENYKKPENIEFSNDYTKIKKVKFNH